MEELKRTHSCGELTAKNAGDTAYHRLTVTTRHPDYRVRTRAGYLANLPKPR